MVLLVLEVIEPLQKFKRGGGAFGSYSGRSLVHYKVSQFYGLQIHRRSDVEELDFHLDRLTFKTFLVCWLNLSSVILPVHENETYVCVSYLYWQYRKMVVKRRLLLPLRLRKLPKRLIIMKECYYSPTIYP